MTRFTIEKHLFWPEWSDSDIVSEKWDIHLKSKDKKKSLTVSAGNNWFDDPNGQVYIPSMLNPSEYKRAIHLFIDPEPTIKKSNNLIEYQLISNNQKLMKSAIMSNIIADISILLSKKGRNENQSFSLPWEHIFPQFKINDSNKLQYNPYGKYAVKLFWMNCWRKIYVDDKLPLDNNKNILLPSTGCANELWLYLLTKALLKIAYLSSDQSSNFSAFQCLTGWLPQNLKIRKNSPEILWKYLLLNVPKWQWSEVSKVSDDVIAIKSKQKEKKDEKSLLRKEPIFNEEIIAELPKRFITATDCKTHTENILQLIGNFEASDREKVVALLQMENPVVEILRVRTIPLTNPETAPPTPAWKLVRGAPTLYKSRLTNDREPIRSLLLRFRQPLLTNFVIPETDEHQEKVKANEETVFETKLSNRKVSSRLLKPKRILSSESKKFKSSMIIDETVELETPVKQTENLEIAECWIDVLDFCRLFGTLRILHNPETFGLSKMISGVQESPSLLANSYSNLLFVESLEPVELLFVLSVVGSFPPDNFTQLPSVNNSTKPSTRHGLHTVSEEHNSATVPEESATVEQIDHQSVPIEEYLRQIPVFIPSGKLLIEKHHWLSDHRSGPVKSLTTTGTCSSLMTLAPGRHCFRIFLEAPIAFALRIAELPSPGSTVKRASRKVSLPTHKRISQRTPKPQMDTENSIVTLLLGQEIEIFLPCVLKEPLRVVEYGQLLMKCVLELFNSFVKLTEKDMFSQNLEVFTTSRLHLKAILSGIFLDSSQDLLPELCEHLRDLILQKCSLESLLPLQDVNAGWRAVFHKPDRTDAFQTFSENSTGEVSESEMDDPLRQLTFFENLSAGKTPDMDLLSNACKGITKLASVLSDQTVQRDSVILLRALLRRQPPHRQHAFSSDDANFLSRLEFSGFVSRSGGPTASDQRLKNIDEHLYSNFQPTQRTYILPFSCASEPPLNLLFRDVFFLAGGSTSVRVKLLLRITSPNGVLYIIDNRTGHKRVIIPGRREDELQTFSQNHLGFTFLALASRSSDVYPQHPQQSIAASSSANPKAASARSTTAIGGGGQWSLQILGEGGRGSKGLDVLNASDYLTTSFLFHELAGVYEPNQRGCLFRYAMKVSQQQMITISLKLSGSQVPLRLVLLKENVDSSTTQCATENGVGECILLSHWLETRAPSRLPMSPFVSSIWSDRTIRLSQSDGGFNSPSSKRSKSKSSADSSTSSLQKNSITPGNVRATIKRPSSRSGEVGVKEARKKNTSNRQLPSARQTPVARTPISSSSKLSTDQKSQVEQNEQLPDEEQTYILEAYVDCLSWQMTEYNWEFLRHIRKERMEELKVDFDSISTTNERQIGNQIAARHRDKRKSSKINSNLENARIANWNCRIYCNADSAEGVVFESIGPSASDLRTLKKNWEIADPGRSEKAAISRQHYLQTTVKIPPETGDACVKDDPFVEEESVESEHQLIPHPIDWNSDHPLWLEQKCLAEYERSPIDPKVELLQEVQNDPYVPRSLLKSDIVELIPLELSKLHKFPYQNQSEFDQEQYFAVFSRIQSAVCRTRSDYFRSCMANRETLLKAMETSVQTETSVVHNTEIAASSKVDKTSRQARRKNILIK